MVIYRLFILLVSSFALTNKSSNAAIYQWMIIGPYCHNFVRNSLFTGICYYFVYKVYILINIVSMWVSIPDSNKSDDRYRLKSA